MSKKWCICQKHFEPNYYNTGAQGKQCRLVKKLKPVPTIFDPDEIHLSVESKHLKSPVSIPGMIQKYDTKLPKLYQIRTRTDVQYSGRT